MLPPQIDHNLPANFPQEPWPLEEKPGCCPSLVAISGDPFLVHSALEGQEPAIGE